MRHLTKNAQMWHQLGVKTVAATSTFDMTFFPERVTSLRTMASKLVDCIAAHREQQLPGSPPMRVIPHSFSNGGALMMLTMFREARLKQKLLRFDGAVYDSLPSLNGTLRPAAAPFVIVAGGVPLPERLLLLARHIPYALLAEACSPIVGIPLPLGKPNHREVSLTIGR